MIYILEEDPTSLQEVLSFLDIYLLKEAINDEKDSLESSMT